MTTNGPRDAWQDDELVDWLVEHGLPPPDDDLAEPLRSLSRLGARLDAVGAHGAHDDAATTALADRIERLARDELYAAAGRSATPRPRLLTPLRWTLGAAAALFAAAVVWYGMADGPQVPDTPPEVRAGETYRLGDDRGLSLEIELREGLPPILTWRDAGRRDAVYRVRVVDVATETVLTESGWLDAPRYATPGTEPWPERVRSDVEYESGGRRSRLGTAVVDRGPHDG